MVQLEQEQEMAEDEFEKDLTIYPELDRLVFATDRRLVNWGVIDEMTDAEPSPQQYQRIMRDLRIGGWRDRRKAKGWKRDEYWD